ncbi:chaoptin [Aedes aegypti]|uniref:Leucine-rich immune protein (TM) n=1 Tax=Aedes aegypti TaxID=7159 RepID=A0A903UFF7_AEDAE|nr:chaoptin [Aedes aegypti]
MMLKGIGFIFLLITISTMTHGIVLECYSSGQNCTFSGVRIDDISTEVTFRSSGSYYYNSIPRFFSFVDSVLLEVPRRIFDTFTVQSLDVNDCEIESLSRYTFEKAKELLWLNMSGNTLTELSNYVFSGANKLSLLDLKNNNISNIEEKAFYNLGLLTTLLLSGNKLKAFDDVVFSHLPMLKKLYAANNELETLQSALFQHNPLLMVLFLQSNKLVYLDKDLFDGIEVMEYLWLRNNSLTSFEFNGLKAKRVNLISNKLKKIKLVPSFENLFLSNNSISEITADDFAELKLSRLDLAWNNLSSMDGIDKISSLEVLDLSHNKIGALKLTSFANLKKLVDLNLEETAITNLQHGTFSQLTALKRLDISYNKLNRIDFDIFTSSSETEEIYIEGNRLKEVNIDEIHKIFPNLKKISIADNNWNCSFLTRMIRSLNALSITVGGFKTENLINDKTNVKGIYCTDSTNPLADWNVTVKHLDKYLNASAPIEDYSEIKQIMQNAIDDINRFTDQRVAIANKSELLEGEIYDLTKKVISVENEIYEVKKTILEVKMAQLANATNETYVSNDLKKMMQELNDLTLSKLKQTKEEMEFKIYQQSFKNDKLDEKITETTGKLLAISKQIDQSRGSLFLSHNSMELKASSTADNTASSGTGSTQIMMVMILCLLIALLVLVVMATYRSRMPCGRKRGERYGTSNTLATIVDDI